MAALAKLLKKSKLYESANVSNLLEAGAELVFETGLKADRAGLIETYQARAQHLATFSSHHANRLKRATEEFCTQLKQIEEGEQIAYAQVDDTLIGCYIVWYLIESNQPIGCLYVIGKSEVPEDAWEAIWNDPDEGQQLQ